MRMEGLRALVTGASRGIGAAIAERFARNGADVALVSRRRESLEAVAGRLETLGAKTVVIPANMSHTEEVTTIIPRLLETWEGLDVLVNNAGTNPVFGPLLELEEKAWDKILDTNLKGPYLLSREAGPLLADAGKGAIVNIASTAGLEPAPMLGAYSVSKAGVVMLTKVLAQELGPRGVRVNCIAPGLVETKFADVLVNTPEIHQAWVGRSALGRHGQPDEIAGGAHYLATEASAFMTGQVLVLDGGSRY